MQNRKANEEQLVEYPKRETRDVLVVMVIAVWKKLRMYEYNVLTEMILFAIRNLKLELLAHEVPREDRLTAFDKDCGIGESINGDGNSMKNSENCEKRRYLRKRQLPK